MLNYSSGSWAAEMQTSAGSASARTMQQNLAVSTDINSNQVRYWMKGPIVTQVIVEDRSAALAYDFGTTAHKSLHPIFVLTFYPNTGLGVSVQYILENMWTTKLQDQSYSLTLTAGGATVFSKPTFNHTARSRWRKVFWSGNRPAGWTDEGNPGINVDYNLAYMISTKALPNYDLTKQVSAAAVSAEVADHNTKRGSDEPQWCYTSTVYCGSWYKQMNAPGGRGDIGPLPTWYVRYLFTFDRSLYPVLLGNASTSGNVPMHLRDSDPSLFFDSARTATALGRPFSIDAHPTSNPAEIGATTRNGWNIDLAHEPSLAYVPYLITGEWYFLEEMYFLSSYNLNAINPCKDAHWCRHESWGFLSNTIETRGVAWTLRNLAHAAFMAPDGTPEKNYYTEKVNNNIEIWEGNYNITNGSFPPTDPSCPNFNASTTTSKWCWGRKLIATRVANGGPNPLGFAEQGDPYASQDLNNVDMTKVGSTPVGHMFEENFLQIVWGHIRELGYGAARVQEFWARWNINLILHPDSNPYHIGGDYGYPMMKPDGQLFDTWAGWRAAYLPTYNPKTLFDSRSGDVEHGYSHIAYAGLSYAPGIMAGSLNGDNAWNWIKTNLLNQNLQNDNPKWAIVPRTAASGGPSCDVNTDSLVNIVDVQLSINRALGMTPCGNADIDQDGTCTVVDVQRIIGAALGGGCRIGP